MPNRISSAVLFVAALFAAIPALAQSPVDRGGRNLFSKEQDIEMGREAAVDAEKQYPVLADQDVQRYVADLGARLAQNAPGYKFPYSFKVVDVADINAFALPGGPLYINRGTVEAARTEGELAGVIAHEISHVDLRHGTRQASKAYGAQIGLSILGSLIGSGESTRQIINTVGGFSLNSVLLKYSRAAETDADILGSQIMARSGYDPKEMASFFDLLAAQSPHRTKDFFSSHPAPERRRERIAQEAALMGAGTYTVSQTRFRQIQTRLHSLPPALTMEQLAHGQRPSTSPSGSNTGSTTPLPSSAGRVEAPSRRLTWYESRQHLFRVARPENWEAVAEGDTSVTLAPPGGAFRSTQGVEVTHGALLGSYSVQGTASRSAWDDSLSRLDEATDEFVTTVRRQSPYLRAVSGSRKRVSIDSGEGLVLTLMGSPSTARARERVDVVTTLVAENRLVYMLFVTPENAPEDYRSLLDAMIRNLKVAGR